MQLAYLRQIQYGDLMMRRFSHLRSSKQGKNEMFVIRNVSSYKRSQKNIFSQPLLRVDIDDVVNSEYLDIADDEELVAGDVVRCFM